MTQNINKLTEDAAIRMAFALKKIEVLTSDCAKSYGDLPQLEQRIVTTIISEYNTYANVLSILDLPGVVSALARSNWKAQEWINRYLDLCGEEETASKTLEKVTFRVRQVTGQLRPDEISALINAAAGDAAHDAVIKMAKPAKGKKRA